MTGENVYSSTEKKSDSDFKRSQNAMYEFYQKRHKMETNPERMKKGRLTVFEMKKQENEYDEE